MPSNAAFHPTIETVGFQTAFSVKVGKTFIQPTMFRLWTSQ
jgi:hypothetical protein